MWSLRCVVCTDVVLFEGVRVCVIGLFMCLSFVVGCVRVVCLADCLTE